MKISHFILTAVVGLAGLQGARAQAAANEERALIAYMRVQPGTEQAFLDEARTVTEESRREEGNIRYQLHQSVTDPQQFVFYELYTSDAALQAHRNSVHVQNFLAKTKAFTLTFTLEEYMPEGSVQ